MLGKISSKPQNVDAVIEAGGVEALVAAFTAAKGKQGLVILHCTHSPLCRVAFPGSLAPCAEAIAELVKREDVALKVQGLSGYQAVSNAMRYNLLTSGVSDIRSHRIEYEISRSHIQFCGCYR